MPDKIQQDNPTSTLDHISAENQNIKPVDIPDKDTQEGYNAFQRESLEGMTQDRKMRKDYANKTFNLVSIWLISVGVILLLNGFGNHFKFFFINSGVLMTLVGGTTLGVIGLFATVAKYLFNEKQIK